MRSFMKWCLIATALMPIMYAKSVLVPSVSPKSLVLRGLVLCVALCVTYFFFSDRTFREQMVGRIRVLWKRSIFKAVSISYLGLFVSTIFAHDRFAAFFGTAERGEGFVGLTFFYLLFFFTAILFQAKDWKRFFGVNLVTGWVLFLGEIIQLIRMPGRPGSLVGNPIYLAGYFLFVIYSGLLLYRKEKGALRWLGAVSSGMAVVGIFLTQSRGVILGLAGGLVVSFIYLSLKAGERRVWKGLLLKRVARGVLACIVLLVGLFIGTRHADFWQKIPGLDRVAAISLSDRTTQARVELASISLRAVNPSMVGLKTTIVGWGWDNYEFAWERFYTPHLFATDIGLFDRAHDKLLDVLVMGGILGLVTYLAIWFFFLRDAFRWRKTDLFVGLLTVCWGVAFFMQNLSAFDSLVTHLAFFAVLAYVTGFGIEHTEVEKHPSQNTTIFFGAIFCGAALFVLAAFVFWTVVPYVQMTRYIKFTNTNIPSAAISTDTFIFSPDTNAQSVIRSELLGTVYELVKSGTLPVGSPLVALSIEKMKEQIALHPGHYLDQFSLAKMLVLESSLTNDPSLVSEADARYLAALAIIPERQDVLYEYTVALLSEGKTAEAVALMQHSEALTPDIPSTHYLLGVAFSYQGKATYPNALAEFEKAYYNDTDLTPALTKQLYQRFFVYFYQQKDFDDFYTTVRRLIGIDSGQKAMYEKILGFMDAQKSIPDIDIAS